MNPVIGSNPILIPVSNRTRKPSDFRPDSGYGILPHNEACTTTQFSYASDATNSSQSYDSCSEGKAIPSEVNTDNQENEPANGGSSECPHSWFQAYLLDVKANPCLKKVGKASSALPKLFDASDDAILSQSCDNHEIERTQIERTHLGLITSFFEIENKTLQAARAQALFKEKFAGFDATLEALSAALLVCDAMKLSSGAAQSKYDVVVSSYKAFRVAQSKCEEAELSFDAAQSEYKVVVSGYSGAFKAFRVAQSKYEEAKSNFGAALQMVKASLSERDKAKSSFDAAFKAFSSIISKSHKVKSNFEAASNAFIFILLKINKAKSNLDTASQALNNAKLRLDITEKEAKEAQNSARSLLEEHAQSSAQNINKSLKEQQDLIEMQVKSITSSNKNKRYFEVIENLQNDFLTLKKNIEEKKYEGKDDAYYENRIVSNIQKLNSTKSSYEDKWPSKKNKVQKEVDKGQEKLKEISETSAVQQLRRVFSASSSISPRSDVVSWA